MFPQSVFRVTMCPVCTLHLIAYLEDGNCSVMAKVPPHSRSTMNRSYVWKNYINDHRSNSHSIPTQVSQANMKFSREGKHFRLSSNNMNKSVSIHSKQRAESNPATSKVTTDAAEVFSNNEVAFFCTLPMITPLFVVQKRTQTFTTTCSCKGSHCVHDLSVDVSRTLCLNLTIIVGYLVMKNMKKWERKEQLHARKNNAWNFAGKQRTTQKGRKK